MIILFHILSYLSVAIYLAGAVLLYRQSRRGGVFPRARRALAFVLLMWGLAYLPACIDPQAAPGLNFQPLSTFTLIAGNLYILFCLLYPLELIQPGWINLRNVVRLFLPYVAIVALYFAVLALLREPVRRLHDTTEMIDRLGEFNVWYRIVLYLCTCYYLARLLVATSVWAAEARSRYGDRIPAIEQRRIVWMKFYGAGIVCITFAYLLVLLYGSLATLLLHRIVALTLFTIVICRTRFGRKLNQTDDPIPTT